MPDVWKPGLSENALVAIGPVGMEQCKEPMSPQVKLCGLPWLYDRRRYTQGAPRRRRGRPGPLRWM